MGKKGKWLVAVKKVFSLGSKDNKKTTQRSKSKKKWKFGKSRRSTAGEPSETDIPSAAAPALARSLTTPPRQEPEPTAAQPAPARSLTTPLPQEPEPTAAQPAPVVVRSLSLTPAPVQQPPAATTTAVPEIEEVDEPDVGMKRRSSAARRSNVLTPPATSPPPPAMTKSVVFETVTPRGLAPVKTSLSPVLKPVAAEPPPAALIHPTPPPTRSNEAAAATSSGQQPPAALIHPTPPPTRSSEAATATSSGGATAPAPTPAISAEEKAATKLQAVFRGYMARRALRALRGLNRLKSLVGGGSVRRQTSNTLRWMQTLAKVQSQIRSQRLLAASEELRMVLRDDRNDYGEGSKIGGAGEWDDRPRSREEIEAGVASKNAAAAKRERALAYAFSHQRTSAARSPAAFVDTTNPHWGWSALERFMAAERHSVEQQPGTPAKAAARHSVEKQPDTPAKAAAAASRLSTPSTSRPPSRPSTPGQPSRPSSAWKARKQQLSPTAASFGFASVDGDDGRSSHHSSERLTPRRHSFAVDEKGTALPSYMQMTESARAKLRMQGAPAAASDRPVTPEKRFSFSTDKSPTSKPMTPRRVAGAPPPAA